MNWVSRNLAAALVFNLTVIIGFFSPVAHGYRPLCHLVHDPVPGQFSDTENRAQTENPAQKTGSRNSKSPFSVTPDGRIEFDVPIENPQVRGATEWLLNRSRKISNLSEVARRFRATENDPAPFWIRLSKAFGQSVEVNKEHLKRIPRSGPLLILANHPLNGVEGMAIAALISQVRADVKVVMTPLLAGIPGSEKHAIFLDPYVPRGNENKAALQAMRETLVDGGALIVFPAGKVSMVEKLWSREVKDDRWRNGPYDMLKSLPETQVLPVFVEGRTSQGFQVMKTWLDRKAKSLSAGAYKAISGVLHFREIGSQVDRDVALVIGEVIDGKKVAAIPKGADAMAELRELVYALPKNGGAVKDAFKTEERVEEPIAAPVDPKLIAHDLRNTKEIFDTSPRNQDMGFKVFVARGEQIPHALSELGRLREEAFRKLEEGSLQARDNDVFDQHYHHLIAWDKATGQIAGSYRLGFVGEIFQRGLGSEGVYTTTFFEYSQLLRNLPDAIELGRSFVREEYRGKSKALFSLWSAIGRTVLDRPDYKYLMGPASISQAFEPRSRILMVEWLQQNHMSELASEVTPRTPVKGRRVLLPEDQVFLATRPTPVQMSNYIRDIQTAAAKRRAANNGNSANLQAEPGSKEVKDDMTQGIPPLLKMYLELGAKVLGINVDTAFNSVDVFVLVDLRKTSPRTLRLYMGEEGARNFLQQHGIAAE